MAQSKNRPSDDEIAQRIGEILEAIRTPEHADDIIEIRKIVRKNVPFFFRSYFAAYLLKDSLSGGAKPGQRDRDRNRNQNQNQNQPKREPVREQAVPRGGKPGVQEPKQKRAEQQPKPRQEAPRQEGGQEDRKNERMAPLPEGVEAATLFVSAGRKRHFYPRHLLELFAGADIPRESIGEIRLFDNYTFVQILASDAPKAVANLDGAAFKGRKLTVNFARKKEEGGDEAPDVPASGYQEREETRAERGSGYGPDEAEDSGRGDSGYRDSEEDAAESFEDTIDEADESEDGLGAGDGSDSEDDGLGSEGDSGYDDGEGADDDESGGEPGRGDPTSGA